jgi:copper transport protein
LDVPPAAPARPSRWLLRPPNTRRRRLLVAAGVVALAAALLPAHQAGAHALLLGAEPAPGSLLTAAPTRVVLHFSEPVTVAGAGLTVLAPSGRLASRGGARAAGADLSALLAGAEQGTYLVSWAVISQDTHPSRGQFTFSVGVRGPAPTGEDLGADVGAVSPAGLLLQVLGRWLHFCGLALALGTVAFQVLVRPARDPRLDRLLLAGVALLAAAEPVALAAQAVSLGLAPQDLLATSFGRVLGLRLGGAFLLWTAAGAVREAGRGRALMLGLGAAIVFADGLAGHRIVGVGDLAAFALGAVHEGAMAVWVGGLLAVLVVREGARRFGTVALGCFLALAASGALLALAHLRGPGDLVTTAYGAVLAVKLAAVAAAALIALLGARRLEALALSGVLVLAALLVSLPPPR